MLERVTLVLNVFAVVTLIAAGLYVMTMFNDLFTPGTRAMMLIGITAYSYKQIEACARQGNKN